MNKALIEHIKQLPRTNVPNIVTKGPIVLDALLDTPIASDIAKLIIAYLYFTTNAIETFTPMCHVARTDIAKNKYYLFDIEISHSHGIFKLSFVAFYKNQPIPVQICEIDSIGYTNLLTDLDTELAIALFNLSKK